MPTFKRMQTTIESYRQCSILIFKTKSNKKPASRNNNNQKETTISKQLRRELKQLYNTLDKIIQAVIIFTIRFQIWNKYVQHVCVFLDCFIHIHAYM